MKWLAKLSFWSLLLMSLNFMLCTWSRRSASNLPSSLFWGEHFLDLNPKLSLFVASLSSCSLRSRNDRESRKHHETNGMESLSLRPQ